MKPTFKISSDERIYIDKKFICNGHWMVSRGNVPLYLIPKPIAQLEYFQPGVYSQGLKAGPQDTKMPDLGALIPLRDGYRSLAPEPIGVEFRGDVVSTYIFETEHITDREPVRVGLDPRYLALLRMGHGFVKQSQNAPVLVLSGESLADDFRALIMPMRIGEKWNASRERVDNSFARENQATRTTQPST